MAREYSWSRCVALVSRKVQQSFSLVFWYNSGTKTIVYVWLNDENTLRKDGADTDVYVVFRKMLDRGNPPNVWKELVAACEQDEKVQNQQQ